VGAEHRKTEVSLEIEEDVALYDMIADVVAAKGLTGSRRLPPELKRFTLAAFGRGAGVHD